MKNQGFYLAFCAMLTLGSCVAPNSTFEKIPPGIWRGVLLLDREPVQSYGDDRDITKKFDVDSELPFNFEVMYANDTSFYIVVHNAEERIEVRDIRFGRDRATGKDTVEIDFPLFDTTIKAIYEDGIMEGDWIVHYRDNYRIPFKAVHGKSNRFEMINNVAPENVAGEWQCTFSIGQEDEYPATGIFKQSNDRITGTFLTETGDYRFLEGIVVGKKMYLSAFDGAHAFLFLGKLMQDGSITGTFRSGSHFSSQWTGIKMTGNQSQLRDADSLTKARKDIPLQFSFPNSEGKMVGLSDEQYRNKAKIIQIMGTWCPNCLDETMFLQSYFAENSTEDIEIISLCFERYKSQDKALEIIRQYKTKLGLQHELLYAGYFDKKEAGKQVPALDSILSYPTLLFVDKQNQIQGVHTGFSGPATPSFASFKEDFRRKISQLTDKK
ncbi:MAG: TlpA family protein disulfide reductase [Saprospiraceae bacterium]|jgi:thiol-disulfide isomerase/thioredoxin|nr:TlpA family protein disulfide reductase [Saprospiraceae bacterium]